MTIKISIDCMGGDFGPCVTVPAAISFIKQNPQCELMLVGLPEVIDAELKKHKSIGQAGLSIVPATEVVTMDDPLEVALRKKKNSSMRVAIDLVKQGQANACVSAGNTGALMAISRYVLKTIPGIDRPAICSALPNQKDRPTYMLDLGANVDCEPQHLHQFAIMASVLVSAIENIPKPTVGLLNVGEEDIKGTEVIKQTAELLRADHAKGMLNFYGNVEGNDIYKGTVDIVVCDGFVGNVTLKASEGLARLFKSTLTAELKRSPLSMLGAFIARGALNSLSNRLNPSRYNGASLLGLCGLVFKSHGNANVSAFEWSLKRAADAATHDVLSELSTTIAELIPKSSANAATQSTMPVSESDKQKIA